MEKKLARRGLMLCKWTNTVDNPKTRTVMAEVIAVIPEFEQSICRTSDGWQYTLINRTSPKWDEVNEGDLLELEVTINYPRIIKAKHVNS